MDFLGDSDSDADGGAGPLAGAGDDGGSGQLRVNSSFAAAYDGEAARRVKQRWRDVAGRVPLPVTVVASLVAGAKAALKEDEGAATAKARHTPADVVRWVMKDRGWRADADAAPLLVHSKGAASASPLPDDVASRLAEAAALKKAVRAAFVYIKKAAFAGGGAPAAARSSAPAPAAAVAGRKRRRADSGSASDGGGSGSVVSRGGADGEGSAAATDGPAPPATAPAPVALDDDAALDAPTSCRKKHGRGAGRGRGLDFRGEPKFDDMHPSWQAKRRAARRQVKLVTKALRGGAGGSGAGGDDGADAAAVVVVVGGDDGAAADVGRGEAS